MCGVSAVVTIASAVMSAVSAAAQQQAITDNLTLDDTRQDKGGGALAFRLAIGERWGIESLLNGPKKSFGEKKHGNRFNLGDAHWDARSEADI